MPSAINASQTFPAVHDLWDNLLNKGQYKFAIYLWKYLLKITQKWETKSKARIHKGMPYGLLAKTFLLSGDIESAFTYLYNSVIEDRRLSKICKDDKYLIEVFINNSNEKLNKILPEDKELLITFIFLMLKRVPTLMDEVKEEMTMFARSQEDKYKDVYLKIPSEVIKRNSLWIVENLGLSQEYNIPKKFASKKILISYVSNDKSSFITTDNPVTRWRKDGPAGFGFDDTEMYFPINHRCFLTMYNSGEDIEIIKLTNRKHIFSLNLYNARFAKEVLISRDSELIKRICKVLKYEILI